MNAATRFALFALAGFCLSLTLPARTAPAAFVVNEIKIQYKLTDANGDTIVPVGTQIVNLINGTATPSDPNSPLAGKSFSDAQLDFTAFTGPANPNVGLTSADLDFTPKFALGFFAIGSEGSGSVLFQLSNAVVINPSAGTVNGFEVDAALTLNPTDDTVTGRGAAGDPDFSGFYGGVGTAHFVFDPTIILNGNGDGTISGFGNVTVTLTPAPEPASVASLLVALGMIGTGAAARRVRSYFRLALTS
jgi:hypothetical protein